MGCRWLVACCLGLLFAAGALAPPPAAADTSQAALILYDASGDWGWLGPLYAKQLANLLGHFPMDYTLQAVEDYVPGELSQYKVTFYLGAVYDNALPDDFLYDVWDTTLPVCWFKYNLWSLAGASPTGETMTDRYGFDLTDLDSQGWSRVTYGGKDFTRDLTDPTLAIVTLGGASPATTVATASRTPHTAPDYTTPYLVKGSNLWYLADIPFSYVNESDRYLAFCDVLHDIVGIDHPVEHHALMRIEDVNVSTSPDALRTIADALYAQSVPFQVAVTPAFRDPLAVGTLIPSLDDTVWQHPEALSALRYMVAHGAVTVAHGYTHQYDSLPNPADGRSADDYEFYRVANTGSGDVFEGALPTDSATWAQERATAAQHELRRAGLAPTAWEVPHYTATQEDYQGFAGLDWLGYGRTVYYVELADGSRQMLGQLFPYVIQTDIYGQKLAPENLGYLDPEGIGPNISLPADLIADADLNLALRDGWASAYFHTSIDVSYLTTLVTGIRALGYDFVNVSPGM